MTKLSILAILAFVFGLNGCIVRPAAETVLTVKQAGNQCLYSSVMGLRDMAWSKTGGKILIVGSGWHPREHETYAFFWLEPYPVMQRRDIRITSEDNLSKAIRTWKVELLLDSSLFPCNSDALNYGQSILYLGSTSCRAKTFFGKLLLNLQDLKLTRDGKPTEVITVSGRVVAQKTFNEKIVSQSNWFNFACNPDVDNNQDFIWEEEAIRLFGIPKSLLESSRDKKPGESGYIWSDWQQGSDWRNQRFFYLKKDIERIATSREIPKIER